MILDDIIGFRREQLDREKQRLPLSDIEKLAESCDKPVYDFSKALKGERLRLICEVKKASPSKGIISKSFEPVRTALEYESSGKRVKIPVLRKDFIIDAYQIFHARVLGASAVLLIAAALDDKSLSEFLSLSHSLGMKALIEVHNEDELDRALSIDPEIIGINNRNLKTFEVSLDTTARLIEKIPEGKIIVSESGIKTNADMKALRQMGADAVLIGETLMRSGNIKSTFDSLTEGV